MSPPARGVALAAMPTQEELGDWAKTIAAIGGILGGIWALARRLWRRYVHAREVRALEAKAVRYLLDAQRHALYALAPAGDRHRLIDVDELTRQKTLIDEVRDELWVADGHASEREEQRRVEGIVRVLTRTQAIQAKETPMFKDREADE